MKRPLFKKIFFYLSPLALVSLFLAYSLVKAQVSPEMANVREIKYTSGDLPDPFESPWERQQAPTKEKPAVAYDLPQMEIQGMIWGSEMPQAIINNTVVRVGESIQGAEIIDIRQEGVYVLYQGRQYILRPATIR